MFFTYAEKKSSFFFGDWQMREVAFDTLHRYLYYSCGMDENRHVARHTTDAPVVNASTSMPDLHSGSLVVAASLGGHREGSPMSRISPSSPATSVQSASHRHSHVSQCSSMSQRSPAKVFSWKHKIKVNLVVSLGRETPPFPHDLHHNERDLYRLEIHGEHRPLVTGEQPAPGPLLCPSASLDGVRGPVTVYSQECIDDPFLLKELFSALRNQFADLRLAREREEMLATRNGMQIPNATNRDSVIRTLQSPRIRTNSSVFSSSHAKVVLRCRSEYEYRRLWYVMRFVLGYDSLCARPYRGLPPYDPRNGITFGNVPIAVYQSFRSLGKFIFYVLIHGNLLGRTLKGDVDILERDVYLCITHSYVLVMKDTDRIRRWACLQRISEFHYNCHSKCPYFAFISDPQMPDLVFMPLQPKFGRGAAAQYNPSFDVRRVRKVIHDLCFASVDVRRVIRIVEATASTPQRFIEKMEKRGGVLRYDQPPRQDAPDLAALLEGEGPLRAWHEVRALEATRDPVEMSLAAIPIYENNPNELLPSEGSVGALQRQLAQVQGRQDGIVGMPLAEVQEMSVHNVPRSLRTPHSERSRRPVSALRARANSGGLTSAQASHAATHDNMTSMAEQRPSANYVSAIWRVSNLSRAAQAAPLESGRLNSVEIDENVDDTDASSSNQQTLFNSSFRSLGQTSATSGYAVPGSRYLPYELNAVAVPTLEPRALMGTGVPPPEA